MTREHNLLLAFLSSSSRIVVVFITIMSATKGLAVVLAEDMYEDLELHYPRLRLKEEGYHVEVVGPKKGHNYNSKHNYWATTTLTFSEVNPTDVKILVVPGGFCTDRLRRYPECNKLVADVHNVCFGVLVFDSRAVYLS